MTSTPLLTRRAFLQRAALTATTIPALGSLLEGAQTSTAAGPQIQDRAGRKRPASPFFAFDNGVGREAKWSPAQQAALLARLGYDGIGYTGVSDFSVRQAAFHARGLRIFNLYVAAYVDRPQAYEPELVALLPQLAGTGTVLWLTVQGRAPDDRRAITILQELADAAAPHGVRIALYPHKGFFVATANDALRLLPRIDRPNVGLTLNLCHELAAGHAAQLDAIVQRCAAHLMLVSINGADPTGGWNELIRPLGEGTFNVHGFLQTLYGVGYNGPIGLQCYNIKQEPEVHLTKSMTAWKRFHAELP
jgi:sugar phosphate isomerase/epimerase